MINLVNRQEKGIDCPGKQNESSTNIETKWGYKQPRNYNKTKIPMEDLIRTTG